MKHLPVLKVLRPGGQAIVIDSLVCTAAPQSGR